MLKLYSAECGYLEAPNLTRTLYSVVTTAETEDEALQYAKRHYSKAFTEGTEHGVAEIKHSIIDWRAGEAVIEGKYSKQFHC
jgi:hypothetical protein